MKHNLILLPLAFIALFEISTAQDCTDRPFGYKATDDTDCHGYFLCHGDITVQQYCPGGQKFDEDVQNCIIGKCPPCYCTTSPTVPTETTIETTKPTTVETTKPTTIETTKPTTIETTKPTTIETTKPTTVETTKQTTIETTLPTTVVTTLNPIVPDCSNYENGHRFPNVEHCRLFWQCVSGRAVSLFCQLDMWYDREYYVCNFRSAVKNCPAMQD